MNTVTKRLKELHGESLALDSITLLQKRGKELEPIRTPEFYSLPEDHQIALNQVSQAYAEAVMQNELIELNVKQSIKQTEESVIDLMSVMDVVMETKMKAIGEFRSWRKTVDSEVLAFRQAMKQIDEMFPKHRIDELKELVGLLKTLNDLKPNDVLKKLIG